jgi:outer membrane lipoprotein-sorting protein
MRRFAIVLVALGIVAGLSLAAAASATTTEEVLAAMSKQRGEVKTFEFDMKTEMKGGPQEGAVMMGHMCSKSVEKDGKPAMPLTNMKMSMDMGGMKQEMLMVHDGEFIWNEMKMMGRVMVMKMKPNPGANKNDPSSFQDQYDLKYVGDEDFDGQKMWVLEGTPKAGTAAAAPSGPAGQQPGKIRISVGQKDNFPHRWILYAKDGTEMAETQITNVKLNPKLDDALFKYTPPAGAQVMDMTKGGMPKMPPPE